MRRSTKIRIITTTLIAFVLVAAFSITSYVVIHNIRNDYDEKIDVLENEIGNNQRYVLLATKEIKAGDVINKNNTISKTIFSSQNQDMYMTESSFGSTALIDIPQDMAIQNTMITDATIDNDLREEEFTSIYLNTNLNKNDYVDIRIVFPNGENYIVVSKKSIQNMSLNDARCFLWLNEEEILTISSAIVDAYLNKGAMLYTSKYIEPTIQDASIVTYSPRADVIELIQNDPNIIKVASDYLSKSIRSDLESRLNDYKNENDLQNEEIKFKTPKNTNEIEESAEQQVEQNDYTYTAPNNETNMDNSSGEESYGQ